MIKEKIVLIQAMDEIQESGELQEAVTITCHYSPYWKMIKYCISLYILKGMIKYKIQKNDCDQSFSLFYF